jgi:hypothetical protein
MGEEQGIFRNYATTFENPELVSSMSDAAGVRCVCCLLCTAAPGDPRRGTNSVRVIIMLLSKPRRIRATGFATAKLRPCIRV